MAWPWPDLDLEPKELVDSGWSIDYLQTSRCCSHERARSIAEDPGPEPPSCQTPLVT